MADIVFRNVTKRYGDTLAVDDASFTVNDNEFFCFFGPPLSGKSTLLRLILGLESPDSGEILIGGKAVNAVSPAERNVAMVFQNLALFPHMSARDNVRFPLVERKVAEAQIERRVADVAAKLHIGHILHKPPAQLSGGERQRVAIARALVRDPNAYLMDDPISALDARLREETRVELKRIQRELGKTLIYVTHDQEEAMSIADRIAILDNGRIRQIGAPTEIYDRPASTYVARLLGSPVMNILKSARGEGGVEAAEGTIRIADRAAPVGAVMIMSECQFAAYQEAGFPVVAIASRTPANAQKVALRWGITTVHDTPGQLIEDPDVEIIDLAFPPDQQPALIRHALKQKHIKAILAQKPLALSVEEAVKLRDEAAKAGKILSVNQNMRYDQSMRVLKQIMDSGALGDIVFAQIDMHAIPHWQTFLEDYDRLTLANMSVHHLDVLRFLFGDPDEITTLTRKDPRTCFDHSDGITVSTLRFPSGVLAVSLEDVWSGPRQEGYH